MVGVECPINQFVDGVASADQGRLNSPDGSAVPLHGTVRKSPRLFHVRRLARPMDATVSEVCSPHASQTIKRRSAGEDFNTYG